MKITVGLVVDIELTAIANERWNKVNPRFVITNPPDAYWLLNKNEKKLNLYKITVNGRPTTADNTIHIHSHKLEQLEKHQHLKNRVAKWQN